MVIPFLSSLEPHLCTSTAERSYTSEVRGRQPECQAFCDSAGAAEGSYTDDIRQIIVVRLSCVL